MGDVNHEPSMEDILASIKRIIAEDGEAALGAMPRRQRPQRGGEAGARKPEAALPPEEVLELTERLDGPAPAAAEPQPVAAQGVNAARTEADSSPTASEAPAMPAANNRAEPPVADQAGPAPAAGREAVSDPTPTNGPAPLVSPSAVEASRSSLAALSALVVRPEPPLPDNTLEGLVREMLRPMLKEWLEARLPGMVEKMVAKEIARITGQG
jgi:uncharacterized protein